MTNICPDSQNNSGSAGPNATGARDPNRLVPTEKGQPTSKSSLGFLLQHCRAYLLQIANQEVPADLALHVSPSDLVQETFADAVGAIDQFRGTTDEELRGWLRKILLHNILDARRHHFETKKRQASNIIPIDQSQGDYSPTQSLLSPAASPSSMARTSESVEKLLQAIDQLPEDYRLVVRLRHFEGLSVERVAEHLGRSPAAVRKLWYRSIEKLADLIDDGSSRR